MSPTSAYMVPVVLLVDDEPCVRRAAAEELEDAGLHVLEAASADEARRLLDEQSDDVQVLITDVDMPGERNGMSLSRRGPSLLASHPSANYRRFGPWRVRPEAI